MMNNKSLSVLVEQVRGVSYKPKDVHDTLNNLSIALLRANNIFEGNIDLSDVIYVDRKRVSSDQILCRGDILVCASSGSKDLVGKAAFFDYDGEYTFGAFCKVVRPKNIDDADYISMFFQSSKYKREITASALGANINNIRNEHIDNLIVNWPVKLNRDNIVSLLKKSKALINLRKKQLQLFDELIKARFVEMFGAEDNPFHWDIINVEEIANVSVGVVIKPAQYYTDSEHGVKAFRSLNIGPMCVKDNDWVYFSPEGHAKNQKSQLCENDLLIVRSGAPGTSCVVTKKFEGCNAIDIIIARPNIERINPYYLCAYTNLPHGKKQIEEGTGGAAQQHFNVGKFNKLNLFLPPLRLQNQFANFVTQIDKSKVEVQRSLEKTQMLFDSLMQQYFG